MKNIRIVLMRTSHAGNIGSVARAMKTMGLSTLYLVEPKSFPDKEATILASHADDILEQATVVSNIDQAVADCGLILATSARQREIDWPVLDPRQAAEAVHAHVNEQPDRPVAILFGQERMGLLNQELQRAHYHIIIPANPDYASLNLAQAVQVISYELRMAALSSQTCTECPVLATDADMQQFYTHLAQGLAAIQFLKPHNHMKHNVLMTRLKRLFQRAQVQQDEVTILRGICSAMQQTIGTKI